MNHDKCHRLRAVWLPMAMAQDLNVGFHMEQTLFRGWQLVAARQEVSPEGLRVPGEEHPPRTERLTEEIVRSCGLRGAMGRRGSVSQALRAGLVEKVRAAGLHL